MSTPRPCRVTEVHVEVSPLDRVIGGILSYTVSGRMYPSRLLMAGQELFALVHRPPPKRVTLSGTV